MNDSKTKRKNTFWNPLLATMALLLLLSTPPLAAEGGLEASVADAMTELHVKTVLLEKIGWDMLTVDVEATGSHVTLRGVADNQANLELAKEVALSLEDVDKVSNHLTVETKESEAPVGDTVSKAELELKDALLEGRVKSKLISEMGMNAFGVEVEAVRGEVSLRGKVDSAELEKMALRATEGCEGVENVIDLLTVEDAS